MNCKPGDLAIVIGDDETPGVIGLVVEVLGPGLDWSSIGDSRFHWRVQFPRPVITVNPSNGYASLDRLADCPDCYLRPITGLPVDEDVRQPEEVDA